MNWIEALILGLIQGLTEYLPVSSSGHLELGKLLLEIDPEAGGLTFDIVVHVATVLATLVILWKEVAWILKGLVRFKWNDEMKYTVNILISMIPVGIVGLCFKDRIEALYADEIVRTFVVGGCLILTSILLGITHFYKPEKKRLITPVTAFIIGIAQAVAVLPGLSRSGSTIATGMLLKCSKKKLAQFSFLMVIPPILGEALLDFKHIIAASSESAAEQAQVAHVGTLPLIVGFVAAFVSGCFACKWMISLVKKSELIHFAVYCFGVGVAALIYAWCML